MNDLKDKTNFRVNKKDPPPKDWLNEALQYDPKTGILTWKTDRPLSHFSSVRSQKRYLATIGGKEAGAKTLRKTPEGMKPSRITICFYEHGSFGAHNIIFGMLGIEVPKGTEIDHRNKNPWDNSFENLRVGTFAQNAWNRKKRCDSKNNLPNGIRILKFAGKPKYASTIVYHQQSYPLGLHDTLEEALTARKKAEEEFHGQWERGAAE